MIQIYKKIFLLSHVIAFAFCCASISEAKTLKPWTGKVVGISDGDTISVMRDRQEVKIRLAEIDCPEGHQPFGGKAKQFTSDRCFKK
ncbi:MAG: thermonuclease family protein, partial [Candidatus Omnitrophica bacterium]|nr:thermonuclease family protein [Candidatus Omnitrophota bacterium]